MLKDHNVQIICKKILK